MASLALTRRSCAEEIAAGLLGVREVAAEDVTLEPGETPYDLAFACRVGVLDGRHPAQERRALARIDAMLAPGAPVLIDP